MGLPASYTYGYVTGRVVQAVSDGPDEGRLPDGIAAVGEIVFTPTAKLRKVIDPGFKAHVQHQDVRGQLFVPPAGFEPPYLSPKGEELHPGELVDPMGEPGIWIPTGNYRVIFRLKTGEIEPFGIQVREEHTLENPLHLVEASPFTPEPGQPVTTLVVPTPVMPGGVLVWRDGGLAWSPAVADLEALAEQAGADAGRAETARGAAEEAATRAETAAEQADSPALYFSGLRDVRGLLLNGWTATQRVALLREGWTVWLIVGSGAGSLDGSAATHDNLLEFPPGFRPASGNYATLGDLYGPGTSRVTLTKQMSFLACAHRGPVNGFLSWPTADQVPTELPGVPL